MTEQSYLTMLEDNAADLIERVKEQRRIVTTPDTPNDIPIDQAVQVCQRISAQAHERMREIEAAV